MATNAAVARIWRRWTTIEDADAYQTLVDEEVLPAIFERSIPGLLGAHLTRAEDVEAEEVEFTKSMWFASSDSIKKFMGEDYQRSHVPVSAQTVLKHFDSTAKHFHVLDYFAS